MAASTTVTTCLLKQCLPRPSPTMVPLTDADCPGTALGRLACLGQPVRWHRRITPAAGQRCRSPRWAVSERARMWRVLTVVGCRWKPSRAAVLMPLTTRLLIGLGESPSRCGEIGEILTPPACSAHTRFHVCHVMTFLGGWRCGSIRFPLTAKLGKPGLKVHRVMRCSAQSCGLHRIQGSCIERSPVFRPFIGLQPGAQTRFCCRHSPTRIAARNSREPFNFSQSDHATFKLESTEPAAHHGPAP